MKVNWSFVLTVSGSLFSSFILIMIIILHDDCDGGVTERDQEIDLENEEGRAQGK